MLRVCSCFELKIENGKLKNGRKFQFLTEFGELVYENDRFIEELGTIQLLHYKLASNEENATSWWFFFNQFAIQEFTQEDFITDLQKYIKSKTKDDEKEVGTFRTLGDDFSCICGTYLSRTANLENEKSSPENNISCPLSELGLLTQLKKGLYRKSIPQPSSFNPYVILSMIADRAEGKSEIRLNELLTAECNIGRIFNLDTISLIEVLRNAEKTGELKIIRTAGLDVIRLTHPEKTFLDYVKEFYKSLNNSKDNEAMAV